MEWGVQIYGPAGQQDGADSLADTIDWVLADIADASQRQPAVDPRYVQGPEQMILNAAYLLRGERAGEFVAAAHALAGARAGIRADLQRPVAAVLVRGPARRLIRGAGHSAGPPGPAVRG